MDNKENFKKEIISSLNFYIKEFNELKDKKSEELINWAIRCSGSYYYKLEYVNQYHLNKDPEIRQPCDKFNETILSFIQNHLQENKTTDPVMQKRFGKDYQIAVHLAKNPFEYTWDKVDWPDFDYDMFATNGFHYYLKAFKTLNCYHELDWENKEKEFWSHEENLKKAILGYTKGWYDDNSTPWFPDHLDWWPKEFWWNDVLAYGAVVFRGKKFEDVVLYPENLEKVEILKLGR